MKNILKNKEKLIELNEQLKNPKSKISKIPSDINSNFAVK
jgi:hypothetical protein